MATFNVRLNRKLLDVVHYDGDIAPDDIRRSLVERGEYPEGITVHRKTERLYVVQGHYGAHGWEDLTADTDYKRARADLRAYQENDTAPVRLITRREPV